MEIKRFIGGILEANCYVVSPRRAQEGADAKAGCFIIDPGYYPGRIEKYIRDNAFAPEGIILTHHHSDHSGAAAHLRKELDCPIMIHREDADRFREGADILLEDGDVLTIGGTRFPNPQRSIPVSASWRKKTGRALPAIRSSMLTWAEPTLMTAATRRWSQAS